MHSPLQALAAAQFPQRSPHSLCLSHTTLAYLDLAFAHNPVHNFVVILVQLGLVVTFFVAEDPQALRSLQLNLKLLSRGKKGVSRGRGRALRGCW